MKPKILVIIGTRPEAIKISVLVQELKKNDFFETILCSTGQHRELLFQALSHFGIKADIDLAIMTENQNLSEVTERTLAGLRSVFQDVRPMLAIVHGDTTSALSAALAAFYAKVPVAHVEAGLRTSSTSSPWPEELNRRLISQIAMLHFAPTPRTRDNLLREHIPAQRIYMTGNTGIDALLWTLKNRTDKVPKKRRSVLITCHRRDRASRRIENLCEAIAQLSEQFRDVDFNFVVHPSPPVCDVVRSRLKDSPSNVSLLSSQSYTQFLDLFLSCYLVITDSGGIQEEAPYLGKPVLVLEDETERIETLECGCSKLVGLGSETIISETTSLLTSYSRYQSASAKSAPYGDGAASKRIAAIIDSYVKQNKDANEYW